MLECCRKILGIDYGDKTIGLAIFDEKDDFIYPYKTIYRKRENVLRDSLRQIIDVIKYEKISHLIIGLPLNLDGTEGAQANKAKDFAKKLMQKLKNDDINNIDFNWQDERLTTFESEKILRSRGLKKQKIKNNIDNVAAMIILEDYKNSKEN